MLGVAPRHLAVEATAPAAPGHHVGAAAPWAGSSRPAPCAHRSTAPLAAAAAAALAALAPALRHGRRAAPHRAVPRRARGGAEKKPRWAPGGGGAISKLADATDIAQSMKTEIVPGNGRCFRVIYDLGIGIRSRPDTNPRYRTGEDLLNGEVFEIRNEVFKDGRRYFELLDGRGWAFDMMEVDGQKVQLVELAAQLYTVAFPDGVSGIEWCSDTTMRFSKVKEFSTGGDETFLTQAGITPGDILVMIDQDPVVGMPFGQVLERLWATGGRQPGSGTFYRVITESPYGIGIRDTPDKDGPRTGEDLLRGTIFEVDEIVEREGEPTYLHLADGRGWVFDLSPVNKDVPTVENLADAEVGCTLTLWRGSAEELAKTIGLRFKEEAQEGKPYLISVIEEGQPIQRIPIQPGTNLRKALVERGFQIYQEMRSVFNCNAQQLCGTCVVDVLEGMDKLTVMSVNEKRSMSANPPSFRLSCNIDVYGDVAVRLRPPGVRYGGGTS